MWNRVDVMFTEYNNFVGIRGFIVNVTTMSRPSQRGIVILSYIFL